MAALERHYLGDHGLSVKWRCSLCTFMGSSRSVAAHFSYCSQSEDARMNTGHDGSPNSESPQVRPSQITASASSAPEAQTGLEDTELVLSYPPARNVCPLCAAQFSSRVKVELHISNKHNRMVTWECSSCNNFHYQTSQSASAHFTKCRRKASTSRPLAAGNPSAVSTNSKQGRSCNSGRASRGKGTRHTEVAEGDRGMTVRGTAGGASPHVDEQQLWSVREMRVVAAARAQLGTLASSYQISLNLPGRSAADVASLLRAAEFRALEGISAGTPN